MIALFATAAFAQDWWDTDWTQRVKVTFDNTAASGPLTDFPVLLLLDANRIDYGRTLPGGQDVRVVDADNAPLDFEIEAWQIGDDSPVWVKVPELEDSATDHVWLYYGNPSAPAPSASDVWSNGYVAVYHLADASDSTGDWDGTDLGSTAASGLIGPARSFDGVDDYIDTTNDQDLGVFTVQAWGYSPASPVSSGDNDGLIMREENYQVNWDHPSGNYAGAASLRVSGSWPYASFGTVNADTWHFLANSYDGETLRAYRDGQLITSNTSPSGSPDSTSYTAKIGKHAFRTDTGATSAYFDGRIDEVRISDVRPLRRLDRGPARLDGRHDGHLVRHPVLPGLRRRRLRRPRPRQLRLRPAHGQRHRRHRL